MAQAQKMLHSMALPSSMGFSLCGWLPMLQAPLGANGKLKGFIVMKD